MLTKEEKKNAIHVFQCVCVCVCVRQQAFQMLRIFWNLGCPPFSVKEHWCEFHSQRVPNESDNRGKKGRKERNKKERKKNHEMHLAPDKPTAWNRGV